MSVRIPLDPSFQRFYLDLFRWQVLTLWTGLLWYLLGLVVEEARGRGR